MHFDQVVRSRRMVRSFSAEPLEEAVVGELFDLATRAPTAGNTDGVAWVVLVGPEQTTTDEAWRRSSARWPGLSRAPVVGVALCSAERYVTRYSDGDKAPGLGDAASGGTGAAGWPVPYWYVDAGFSAMVLLLAALERGLGACFLGAFRGEEALLGALGVPAGWRCAGAVVLGHPDGLDHRSSSLDRPKARDRAVHHGRWAAQ
jgi:nitroreductase